MTVFEFLQDQARLPTVPGVRDCALMASDWMLQSRGVDPAAPLRGTYSTEEECAAILVAAGGLLALSDRLCLAAGLVRVAAPALGDLGVVSLPGGPDVGAVCTGRLWGIRTARGTAEVRLQARAAWRLPS